MPYPTIVGIVAGGEWASTVMDRVTADGRYGVRLGQSPGEAEAELRACIEAACAADPFLRDHPATVEITGARFASSSVPADHPLVDGPGGGGDRRDRPRRHARSASRTAATCACSSASARRRASSSGRATCAWRTRPTSPVPLDEVEACARSSPPG